MSKQDESSLPDGMTPIPIPKPLEYNSEPLVSWFTRVRWRLQAEITWPRESRRLKREGWKRVGWRTWQSPEGDNISLREHS